MQIVIDFKTSDPQKVAEALKALASRVAEDGVPMKMVFDDADGVLAVAKKKFQI